MKFLVDAQLPYGIAWILNSKGFDALHTDDLPDKERTSDQYIREVSLLENRIVVTKDADFVDSHHIKNVPQKLLLVSTGNIRNKELFQLFSNNLPHLISLLDTCSFIELNNTDIIGHG